VLSLPNGPNVAELGSVGVARISVGTAFFNVAMNALADAAREWRDAGTHGFWPSAIGGMAATKDAFE
jgi:2-methylisocitrate lyase-like PEP mutase family enzyme